MVLTPQPPRRRATRDAQCPGARATARGGGALRPGRVQRPGLPAAAASPVCRRLRRRLQRSRRDTRRDRGALPGDSAAGDRCDPLRRAVEHYLRRFAPETEAVAAEPALDLAAAEAAGEAAAAALEERPEAPRASRAAAMARGRGGRCRGHGGQWGGSSSRRTWPPRRPGRVTRRRSQSSRRTSPRATSTPATVSRRRWRGCARSSTRGINSNPGISRSPTTTSSPRTKWCRSGPPSPRRWARHPATTSPPSSGRRCERATSASARRGSPASTPRSSWGWRPRPPSSCCWWGSWSCPGCWPCRQTRSPRPPAGRHHRPARWPPPAPRPPRPPRRPRPLRPSPR